MSGHFLTAETEQGRRAIEEVMVHSYEEDIDRVPPGWAIARIVDGVPVSFALVDPNEPLLFPNGAIRRGFLRDIATREDRRLEGHFRATMQEVFDRLRLAKIHCSLDSRRVPAVPEIRFRRLHPPPRDLHSAGPDRTPSRTVMLPRMGKVLGGRRRPAQAIRSAPGHERNGRDGGRCQVRAAGRRGHGRTPRKEPDLFEYPPAGRVSVGHVSLDSPFRSLALACGAQVRVEGGVPEGRPIPDGDWIKVLDAVGFVEEVIRLLAPMATSLPSVHIGITCDAGDLTITSSAAGVTVSAGRPEGPRLCSGRRSCLLNSSPDTNPQRCWPVSMESPFHRKQPRSSPFSSRVTGG